MKFNHYKACVFLYFLIFSTIDLIALPLPIPPSISLKDIIKHGKRAIEKNKEDKNNQEEYRKDQNELEKISEKEEIIKQKRELRKKFNGNWIGGLILKKQGAQNITCNIKIIVKNFEGKLDSNCKDIKYSIYLYVNLDRNLERSFIKTSIHNNKIKLLGDLTSFYGHNEELNVKGSLEKH
tara:strand:- start:366 stop:905 length:540 start_codon:yes stop_codon:yes gene_type:complete